MSQEERKGRGPNEKRLLRARLYAALHKRAAKALTTEETLQAAGYTQGKAWKDDVHDAGLQLKLMLRDGLIISPSDGRWRVVPRDLKAELAS